MFSGNLSNRRYESRRLNKSATNTINGSTVLSPDFKEFLQLLNENNVKYLIVGAYAVAVHGHPRYTGDLDVWIETTAENAQRIAEVLDRFGFGSTSVDKKDFLEIGQVIQLGYPPNRIDILTSLDGIEFSECYPRRVEFDIDGIQVRFVDLESLKKNKRAVGRYQDLADLEKLEGKQ